MKIHLEWHDVVKGNRVPGRRFNGDNRQEIAEIRRKTQEYESRRRERADNRLKGHMDEHQRQLYEAETLFDLQTKQLSKMAVVQNKEIDLDPEEKAAQRKEWDELIQPSEAILEEIRQEIFSNTGSR
ncbi:hypothetical protein PV08_12019 [Exophiala spinifera]|uniref:Uncharacterized protein n=1 Tax=Exophiala spinifera TaxID=91928 RepID=A0A0D2AT82_9EURO|nr:uncharacterized protein PV08_12019 [Exophiala spinifera]KIW09735.1 hypothetical protein PV08_12019 [Exophiala spinifera]